MKSTKPKRLGEALTALPRTLDETYERMLVRIGEMDRTDALTALRWLTFGHRPLTLSEIADASVVDPTGEGVVETDNRGGVEDVLELLSDLIIVDGSSDNTKTDNNGPVGSSSDSPGDFLTAEPYKNVSGKTRVRLAHFSVKEYLVRQENGSTLLHARNNHERTRCPCG